jgi:soluble lytic murein transglycosylase
MIRLGAVLLLTLMVGLGLGSGPSASVKEVRAEVEDVPGSDAGFLGYYLQLAGESVLGWGIVEADAGAGVAAVRTRGGSAASLASNPGVAELKRGVELREKDAAAARSAFLRAAELLPGLADWAHVLAADAASRTGDTTAVRRLLADTEPILAREWGWRSVVRAHRVAGAPTGAAEVAANAAAKMADAARAADAWRVAGDLRLQRGDSAAARVAYRNAIELSPGSEHALAAARALTDLRAATPDDRLAIGRLYLRHGNFDRGIAGLEAYIASGKADAAERAELRFEIGRALFRAGRYADAERRLAAVLESSPRASFSAEAMLLMGRAQFRQNKRDAARATLLRTAERYPTAEASAEALFIVADLDHDDERLARARELYTRAVAVAPTTSAGADAAVRLGMMAYVSGDARNAAQTFEAYLQTQTERSRRQQALFWAGRAHHAAGTDSIARVRLAEAQALEPATYYGMRAADLLADGSWRAALRPDPQTTTRSQLESTGALFRLDVLREVGLEDAASYETDRLRRFLADRDDALYALAEAFHARGEIFRAISVGREIQRQEQGWNERLLRIVYPFPYQQRIEAEAQKVGIDPYLVAALIRQESMFNPIAVSPAGAIGLMQIMPATGRALARQTGIGSFSNERLKDPDVNVRLGVLFMSQLLRQYNGRLPDLLAAYNAGSGRLARWRAFPEYRDDDLFAERIPFAETRHYVKVVQQNQRIYAAIYGPRGEGTLYGE